jgi:hypothetical protein
MMSSDQILVIEHEFYLSIRKRLKLRRWLKVHNFFNGDTSAPKKLHLHFLTCFDEKNDLVFCSDINKLFEKLCCVHLPEDWRLFIDAGVKGLKVVLLNNKNHLPPVLIAYSDCLPETYQTLQLVLNSIQYNVFQWKICCDLKIVTLLLGFKKGNPSFPCYFCLFPSRNRCNHYSNIAFQQRATDSITGLLIINPEQSIENQPLVPAHRILVPPLHVKLGLCTQFIKLLVKQNQTAAEYLIAKFSRSAGHAKQGILNGPQIKKLLSDQQFDTKLNTMQAAAWNSFRAVCDNFLGNNRSENYKELINDLLRNYNTMGCLMSKKVHLLHSHLNLFPENCGDMSDEHGERFHKILSKFQENFKSSKLNKNMIAYYCSSIVKTNSEDKGEIFERKSF